MRRFGLLVLIAGLLCSALPALCEPFAFDATIGADLPVATFTIEKVGEQFREDSARAEGIFSLTLTEKDNPERALQRLFYTSEEEASQWSLTLKDINFDGYNDLQVLFAAATTREILTFFLWDPALGQYVYTDLNFPEYWLSLYELYPEKRMILNYTHESAVTGIWDLFGWQDGQLVLLRRAEALYVADPASLVRIAETVTDFTVGDPYLGKVVFEETVLLSCSEEDRQVRQNALLEMLWDGM